MISVIVCTHNPREAYLRRVVTALSDQTLPRDDWELLLIDNASPQRLALPLDWHPHARIVREERLGLTPARLRGISESQGDVLVFVDDDNVLAKDYLAEVIRIRESWPILGAWGGRIDPEFERLPPEWTQAYWHLLALASVDEPRWSNSRGINHAIPPGAGQCVLRSVALRYSELVRNDPLRHSLDRVGDSFSSCGDIDLALTSLDLGLGTGQFPTLRLTHIIPPSRLEFDYLLKLVEGVAYSAHVFGYLHGQKPHDLRISHSRAWFEAWQRMRLPARQRAFARALERARQRALADLAAIERQRLLSASK